MARRKKETESERFYVEEEASEQSYIAAAVDAATAALFSLYLSSFFSALTSFLGSRLDQ
jgi:hypothetical protein